MVDFGLIDKPEDVRDVLNEAFGEGKFDLDFVEWLASSPFGPNRWYGAFDGGRPVATYALLPMIVDVDGSQHFAGLCNNVSTVPNHRGRGIFTALGRYALAHMKADVYLGVPNEQAVPGHRKVGWERLGKLELLSGEARSQWREVKQNPVEHFKYYPFNRRLPPEGPPRLMVSRGEAFMRWRYSKPGQTYVQSMFPDFRHVVWKEFEGRKQVMETNDWECILGLGGVVDVWQFEGSRVSGHLKGLGFESRFDRDFIAWSKVVEIPREVDRYRFELCENDVF